MKQLRWSHDFRNLLDHFFAFCNTHTQVAKQIDLYLLTTALLLRVNVFKKLMCPCSLIGNSFVCFLSGQSPASFCLFSFFSNTNFTDKNYMLQRDSNSDRQRVECNHADHLSTSTTALLECWRQILLWEVLVKDRLFCNWEIAERSLSNGLAYCWFTFASARYENCWVRLMFYVCKYLTILL